MLSLGGGAVTTPGVRDALAGHTVIYLEISAAEGVRRTGGSTVRPLLAGPDRAEKYQALMDVRVPLYRRVATMRVNTNRRNPGAVVRHIVARLDKSSAHPPAAKSATAVQNRPRRRRRPPWRRDATKEQQQSDGPPTPAMMAARRVERTPDPDSATTMEKNT